MPNKDENISVGRRCIVSHLENKGVDVTVCSATMRNGICSWKARDEYNVVIGTTRAGALLGTIFKIVTGTPLVVDHVDPISQFEETNPYSSPFVKVAEHFAFTVANHVLYVYPEEEDRVSRFAPSYTKTELGVELDLFVRNDVGSETVVQEHDESEKLDTKILVYVGGLEPMYNIEELLDTLPYLEGWTLVVAGTGSKEEVVKSRAKERDDVVFLGALPHGEIANLLSKADVGISLVDDPYTLKVLEYLAAGLSVVQIEGRSEERFGDMLTYCDLRPESIARAVDKAEDRTRSDEGLDFVEEFSWESIAETYETVIRSYGC